MLDPSVWSWTPDFVMVVRNMSFHRRVISPAAGRFFARLDAGAAGVNTMLSTTIPAAADTTMRVSFDACFVSGDLQVNATSYNDDALALHVALQADYSSLQQTLLDLSVLSVGEMDVTCWIHGSALLPPGISHTLSFRVRNFGDALSASSVLVDNVDLAFLPSTTPSSSQSDAPSPSQTPSLPPSSTASPSASPTGTGTPSATRSGAATATKSRSGTSTVTATKSRTKTRTKSATRSRSRARALAARCAVTT